MHQGQLQTGGDDLPTGTDPTGQKHISPPSLSQHGILSGESSNTLMIQRINRSTIESRETITKCEVTVAFDQSDRSLIAHHSWQLPGMEDLFPDTGNSTIGTAEPDTIEQETRTSRAGQTQDKLTLKQTQTASRGTILVELLSKTTSLVRPICAPNIKDAGSPYRIAKIWTDAGTINHPRKSESPHAAPTKHVRIHVGNGHEPRHRRGNTDQHH